MELTPITAGQVVLIPLKEIEPDPDQPRRSFDEDALAELAEDIKVRGVQQPITIRKPVIAGELYTIKTGERRYQASRLAGKQKIPCLLAAPEVVGEDHGNAKLERLFDQVKENHLREELGPLDWAYAFRRLREEFGLKVGEIAEACTTRGLRMSRPHVSNIMRLAELPDWAQDLIRSRKLTAGHGKVLFAALHSEAVAETIQAQLEDPAQESPSVRDLQEAIARTYQQKHQRAWELERAQNTGDEEDANAIYAPLLERKDELGIIEVPSPYGEGNWLFTTNPDAFHAAIDEINDAEMRDDDDDADEDEDDEPGAGQAAAQNPYQFRNPLWDINDGCVPEWRREPLLEHSIQRWLVQQVRELLDRERDYPRLAIWAAFYFAHPDFEYSGGGLYPMGHEEHGQELEAAAINFLDIDEASTPRTPRTWQDWRDLADRDLDHWRDAAITTALATAPIPFLLELAGLPTPDINDYRCDADYFKSLDRDDFELALDRLSDAVPPGEIPDGFDARVALLVAYAELFGVPDVILDAWRELTTTPDDES